MIRSRQLFPPVKSLLAPSGTVVLLVLLALSASALAAPAGAAGVARQVTLGIQLVVTMWAMAGALVASGATHQTRVGSAWRLLAASGLLSVAALVAQSTGLRSFSSVGQLVSLDDLLRLCSYVPMLAGLSRLTPPASDPAARRLVTLDAVVFSVAVTGVAWEFLARPALSRASDVNALLVTGCYSVADLIAFFAVVSLLLRLPAGAAPFYLLCLIGSFGVQIVGNVAYFYVLTSQFENSSSLVGPVWVCAKALIVVAAMSVATGSGRAGTRLGPPIVDLSRLRVLQIALPYLSIVAVIAVLVSEFVTADRDPRYTSVLYITLLAIYVCYVFALLLVRQLLALRDNIRLSSSLSALSQSLEQRVLERTDNLSALNQAAAALALSRTMKESLDTGLDHALRATRLRAGVAWTRTQTGSLELATTHGGGDEAAALSAWEPAVTRAIEELIRSGEPKVLRLNGENGLPTVGAVPTSEAANAAVGQSALLVVPIATQGSVLGTFGLVVAGGADVDEAHCALALSVASQTAVAFQSARRYEEIRALSERDPVTGLLNHRAFHARLDQETRRATRTGASLAVVMMDLDGFKLFNDTYGHPVGDRVLRSVAGHLLETVRVSDVVARYGGDEFAAILPDTSRDGAVAMAERVRAVTASDPHISPEGTRVPVRMSFGIATFPRDAEDVAGLVACADVNLFEARRAGGDRVAAGDRTDGDEVRPSGTFGVLDGLVTAVDNKDHYTRQHSEDVTRYALMMARQLSLSEETQRTLRIAGLLHDVGKIGVPDRILRKPGRLTDEEFGIVRQHAALGEMIVKEVPNAAEVIAAIGAHHERIDGSGYPKGLKGSAIPLLARVLSVADAYSAMTTDRPYRAGLSADDALAELLRGRDLQFDRDLVDVFVSAVNGQDPAVSGSDLVAAK